MSTIIYYRNPEGIEINPDDKLNLKLVIKQRKMNPILNNYNFNMYSEDEELINLPVVKSINSTYKDINDIELLLNVYKYKTGFVSQEDLVVKDLNDTKVNGFFIPLTKNNLNPILDFIGEDMNIFKISKYICNSLNIPCIVIKTTEDKIFYLEGENIFKFGRLFKKCPKKEDFLTTSVKYIEGWKESVLENFGSGDEFYYDTKNFTINNNLVSFPVIALYESIPTTSSINFSLSKEFNSSSFGERKLKRLKKILENVENRIPISIEDSFNYIYFNL